MNKALAIIPVFNEKTQIGLLLDRFPYDQCDALAVDDASFDGTTAEIHARPAQTLRHENRSGVGRCLQDGFRYAKDKGYEVVVVMAGNGKDDPREIPRLLTAIGDGAEYVQGSRFMQGGEWKNLPRHRWWAIKALTLAWSVVMGRRLTDVTNGFRAYRMSFLERPQIRWTQEWLATYELEYYLHYYALALGVPFREVAVSKNYPTRTNYSKIRAGGDWWRIIRPLFLLRFGFRS